ncbi:MAG: ATP-binding protein [Deltaproteobacteria bacterium]
MALRPTAWLDATIPDEVLADPHLRVRARLVQMLFVLASLGLIIAGIARFADSGQLLISHVVPLTTFVVGATLLRLTKRLWVAAVAVLAAGHLALVFNAFELGGMVVVFTWDTVLLAGAVYILGPKAGWGVAIVSVLTAIPMAVARDAGWIANPLVETSQLEMAIMATNQLVVMTIFAGFYFRENRQLAERLEAARQVAEASNQAKSVFLATMSHEIRTPMNGVLASADLLRRGELHEEERALAEMVFTSGEALLSILNDILDFSKLEAGEVDLERAPFSLQDCVQSSVDLLRARAQDKGVELKLEVAASAPKYVVGDGARLRQVLLNLIGNAVKFTERGHVRVSVAPQDGRIELAVEDTGVGIAAEQLERLFIPFSQANASVHRTYGGTGLGLAISQHLVRAMGGRIEVKSTPGRGSRFSFVLPLKTASVRPLSDTAAGPDDGALPQLDGIVLVVDDNPTNRKVAEKMLQHLGCRTKTVDCGEDAITTVQNETVSLVLMDRLMPGLDGPETTERIRALEGDAGQTPIIGLTASAFAEEVAMCEAAGMQEVVAKPVTLRALREAVVRRARRRVQD